MKCWIFLILLVAISGCTSIRGGEGLIVSLQADPPSVFSNSYTILHIDVDNRQEKSVRNVIVELFDTGLLQSVKLLDTGMLPSQCSKVFVRMLPYEFQSLSCNLSAPEKIEEPYTEAEVNVRTSFDNELSAVQVFEIISEEEYARRSYGYASSPRSYSYMDKNVQMEIEFSEQPPLVARPGRQYFVYLTITNIGNGFVNAIEPDDIVITPANPGNLQIIRCPVLEQQVSLYANSDAFPRIACEIMLPPLQVLSSRNADFIVTITYEYEVRDKLRINIAR